MSSPAIGTMCATLKWVSKYDFIFGNEGFVFSKITFIRGSPKSTLKRYEFDRNVPKNASKLRELENPHISLKSVSKNYLIFLSPYFHFFQIAFVRAWSNLGLK
jgi:hypothetical protein